MSGIKIKQVKKRSPNEKKKKKRHLVRKQNNIQLKFKAEQNLTCNSGTHSEC